MNTRQINLPVVTSARELEKRCVPCARLGSGRSGTVLEALVRENDKKRALALKYVYLWPLRGLDDEEPLPPPRCEAECLGQMMNRVQWSMAEIEAMCLCNVLLKHRVCASFPRIRSIQLCVDVERSDAQDNLQLYDNHSQISLTSSSSSCGSANSDWTSSSSSSSGLDRLLSAAALKWGVSMERFDCNLEQWECCAQDCNLLGLSAAAQLLLGCVAMAELGLLNNDAYGRNILVKRTSQTQFTYRWHGQTYNVPTHGYRFALTDFGLATRESRHGHRTCVARNADESVHHPTRNHVLRVPHFPPYARDLSAVLLALSNNRSLRGGLWLRNANAELDRRVRSSSALRHRNGLYDFVETVLSQQFLEQSSLSRVCLGTGLSSGQELFNLDVNKSTLSQEARAQFERIKRPALKALYLL